MKIEDIKVGMKVKLLSKHVLGDNYDNIENFYKDKSCYEEIRRMKEQGYGIVNEVNVENGWVLVSDELKIDYVWHFLPSHIEPYEEDGKESEDLIQEKSLREWIVTPKVIFTLGDGDEYFVGNNGYAYSLDNGDLWCHNKNESYDEELKYQSRSDSNAFNIVKIEYQGKIIWQREEEYFTLTEAIQLNKQIKHKDWAYFHEISSALKELSDIVDESTNNDFILKALSEKVWQVK